MKSIAKTLIICLIFLSQLAICQNVNNEQLRIAETCLNYIIKGENDSCRLLIDTENTRDLTKDKFETTFAQLNRDLSIFDSFKFSNVDFKINFNKKFIAYTFDAISEDENISNDISVEILFLENSNLIATVEPKLNYKNFNRDPGIAYYKVIIVESSFKVKIDKKKYNIKEITIGSDHKNIGLLTIEVLCDIPDNIRFVFGDEEREKIAKFFVKSDYFKKAQAISVENNLILAKDMRITFTDSRTGFFTSGNIKIEKYNK